jgi:hypothetical protein
VNQDEAMRAGIPAPALAVIHQVNVQAAHDSLAVVEVAEQLIAEIGDALTERERPTAPVTPLPANDHDQPTTPEQPGRPVA